MLGIITIDIDPYVRLGPLTLAWHGLTVALGLLAGGFVARRKAERGGLDPDRLTELILVAALAGLVGAKIFFLVETDPAALLRPKDWIDGRGFAFNGAFIATPIALATTLRMRGLSLRYLDAAALGFPVGMALGRVGDVINGEHHGPASNMPWALRHLHPDASVPSPDLAYHDGGLYEIALALAILPIVRTLHRRELQPLTMLWTVIGLYGLGRFGMFFARSDSAELALGLSGAQWTSLALVVTALAGFAVTRYRRRTSITSNDTGTCRPIDGPTSDPALSDTPSAVRS